MKSKPWELIASASPILLPKICNDKKYNLQNQLKQSYSHFQK